MKKVLAMVLALAAVLTIAVASVGAATLSDGTYTVPVKLWKASSDGASMAQVIGDNATVEGKDGAITMTVTTKQMEMMGITGDLTGLRVSDGKGGYVDATVTSTDANGLPTAFTFPVAASDYESGYIKVQEKAKTSIPVDAMDDWMDARIKVDTAAAKETAPTSTVDVLTSASKSDSNPLAKILALFKK